MALGYCLNWNLGHLVTMEEGKPENLKKKPQRKD